LEEDDLDAWNFYAENATPFVQEYGLMPGLLARRRYYGVARDIFLAKINLIHATVLGIRAKRIDEARGIISSNPGSTIFAEERT
jgi:hypothetical protein